MLADLLANCSSFTALAATALVGFLILHDGVEGKQDPQREERLIIICGSLALVSFALSALRGVGIVLNSWLP